MDDERDISRLWRVNKTIHELVRDRGFLVADHEIEVSLDDFKAEFAANGTVDRQKLNFFTHLKDNEEEKILVYYALEKNVGIKGMRSFIGILEEQNIQRGIMIWSEKMTSAARKVIDAMRMQFKLEDFEEATLLVNITHHHLVPKHEVMTKEEKTELLQRYRLKETQLPRIQINDPVARYFGLTRGQVVKITRPSETSGRYCSYRICI
ncbi:putative 25 kd subunit of DNA-directed RNA polymerases I, II and III [Microstroma glucosiphilum]|uniref:DNA-directed RNA polymerases I, II, and III subunit RPABC1 n=1 Tax=Pseudomicrostroma glucosiphilum TaxID=1684307 RepID=A0A316UD53_9BASI|nr:putative 25 kd subunit of DNA-directed RNA polymerases I, II and III [Pseudomicrostroma glucosiphilum]PWN22341.1 putative 25 kd subunit of DNA-directed RNA polymerases I, II and III [Pseudomicrostroma glucosiphilum]